MNAQSGFVALLYIVFLAAVVSMTTGVLVAHLEQGGVLLRGTGQSWAASQQAQLQGLQKLLAMWYAENAWSLDSQVNPAGLPVLLSRTGISAPSGMAGAMSNLIVTNGIGYHVIAIWFPVPGAIGTGIDPVTGIFHAGTVNGQLANTPFALVSGFPIEAELVQKTRVNLDHLADDLAIYYTIRQAADADLDTEKNWFRDAQCSMTSLALPCYGNSSGVSAAIPVLQTDLARRTGLSSQDETTGWGASSPILINNYSINQNAPYQVALYAALPWGGYLTVQAVSG